MSKLLLSCHYLFNKSIVDQNYFSVFIIHYIFCNLGKSTNCTFVLVESILPAFTQFLQPQRSQRKGFVKIVLWDEHQRHNCRIAPCIGEEGVEINAGEGTRIWLAVDKAKEKKVRMSDEEVGYLSLISDHPAFSFCTLLRNHHM